MISDFPWLIPADCATAIDKRNSIRPSITNFRDHGLLYRCPNPLVLVTSLRCWAVAVQQSQSSAIMHLWLSKPSAALSGRQSSGGSFSALRDECQTRELTLQNLPGPAFAQPPLPRALCSGPRLCFLLDIAMPSTSGFDEYPR